MVGMCQHSAVYHLGRRKENQQHRVHLNFINSVSLMGLNGHGKAHQPFDPSCLWESAPKLNAPANNLISDYKDKNHSKATLEILKTDGRKFKSHRITSPKKINNLSLVYFLPCCFMWFYIITISYYITADHFVPTKHNLSISPI